MRDLLIEVFWLLTGLLALASGGEALVRGASQLALSLGIAPLVVGLTIVAMGTSAPELAVSVSAVLSGIDDIAVGNVVGSNIVNVLVILGLSALIAPLTVHSQIIRQEVPIMVGAAVLVIPMMLDGRISGAEAAILLALLVAYMFFLVLQSRHPANQGAGEYSRRPGRQRPGGAQQGRRRLGALLLVAAGLVLLVLGARWLVAAATNFARVLGLDELVIGLTIVAVGTSLPELATSIIATVRGERDIAVGNVVGSGTFNILGCLGAAGLTSRDGLGVAPAVLNFDAWVMLAVSVACLPVLFSGRQIARWEGALFLLIYAAYTAYLVMAARQHAALGAFSGVMLSFVIPIVVVTLLASLLYPTGADGSAAPGQSRGRHGQG